ncbi:MAG: VWA domain-containing protein [Acidobacteria bacterium]|nr:VWA domain-containing protein [Acidobacteriota bacterium]
MLPSRSRAYALAFASAIALSSSLPGSATAQSREITAYVSALDARGAILDALAPADVVVREDGVAREVLRVTPATDPLQVVLLVDNSAATRDMMADIRRALPTFFTALGDSTEVTLVTIADRPTVAVAATTSRAALQRGVERLFPQPSAGSYVMDAIVETSRDLEKRGATRPVIVVVTTDGVEFSNVQADAAIDAMISAGAALHVVIVNTSAASAMATDEGRQRAMLYDRGVRATGGQRLDLLTSQSFEKTLQTLATELTRQFKVVYARPVSLIPPERVTIGAARDAITVRGIRAPLPRTR